MHDHDEQDEREQMEDMPTPPAEDDQVTTNDGNGALDQAQAKIEELTQDLKRVQAEFVNYRRRAESEKADLLDFAKARIIREFLSVRDSFDQEEAHRPKNADAEWAKSIDAIRTQFDQVMHGLGAKRLKAQGQPFDPHVHEAVVMEDGEGEHEVVMQELRPGYKLGDTILRHAVVKVGRTSQAPPAEDHKATKSTQEDKEN